MKEREMIEEINDIISEEYNNGNDNWFDIAEKVYSKLFPKDSVVLTNDNAEELANLIVTSPQMQSVMSDLIKAWQKETAEKILKELWAEFEKPVFWADNVAEIIKELAKQFGVEIKE